MLLLVRAGGEVKLAGIPSIAAVANDETPQPVDDDRFPIGVTHLVNKRAVVRIEDVDMPVAEISDPQLSRQCPEISRCYRHAPGRLEVAALSESLEEITIEVEHIHDATAFARYVVARVRVPDRVGHIKFVAEDSDVERRKASLQIWTGKRIHDMKIGIILIHHAGLEIGGIKEERAIASLGDGESLIGGVPAVLRNRDDPVRPIDAGSPADNRSILGCKEKGG